ncbi:MAG: hypothetical protein MJY84_00335 [Bacteroidales bacterium]|nr:hypothetical protein [Bacteroidales bacterium]
MKYIISSFISLAIIVSAFFYFRAALRDPFEAPDDPAWECMVENNEAHLLAERSDKKSITEREALVQWGNGTRSWVKVSELPHYYKIKGFDPMKTALICKDSLESRVIGKSLREIETTLAYPSEIIGADVVFPIRVLAKDDSLSTDTVTITFKDSLATDVEYSLVPDKNAKIYSMIPGLFSFVRHGIRAPQRHGFISYSKEDDAKTKKDYHFGDITGRIVSGLARIVFFLVLLVLLVAVPFITSLPLLMIYTDYVMDDTVAILIGVAAELLFLYVFTMVCLIFDAPSMGAPIISAAVCTVLTILFYKIFN